MAIGLGAIIGVGAIAVVRPSNTVATPPTRHRPAHAGRVPDDDRDRRRGRQPATIGFSTPMDHASVGRGAAGRAADTGRRSSGRPDDDVRLDPAGRALGTRRRTTPSPSSPARSPQRATADRPGAGQLPDPRPVGGRPRRHGPVGKRVAGGHRRSASPSTGRSIPTPWTARSALTPYVAGTIGPLTRRSTARPGSSSRRPSRSRPGTTYDLVRVRGPRRRRPVGRLDDARGQTVTAPSVVRFRPRAKTDDVAARPGHLGPLHRVDGPRLDQARVLR